MPARVRRERLWSVRTTPLHRARCAAKEERLRGSGSSTSAMPNDITKCRFAPFRYIGPRVKPAAMHLWLSATSHIGRFSKSLRQVQALGLMDFVNPRPVRRKNQQSYFERGERMNAVSIL